MECRQCGRCCTFEIPLTLLDLHRIAKFQNQQEEEVFSRCVQKGHISKKAMLLTIQKRADRSCIFLDRNGKCSIHPAKPRACEVYYCDEQRGGAEEASRQSPDGLCPRTAILWEHSIAALFTRVYVRKNGTSWNVRDYHKAIRNITAHIPTRPTEKLKLARDENQKPVGMVYDCSRCRHRRSYAQETIITLLDIQKITSEEEIPWERFFALYVDSACSSTGALKLKRQEHCVFFSEELMGCSIEANKPVHCRFTPCPARSDSCRVFDQFYLASGTVEEQYRHQVAIAVTRNYVDRFGTGYHEKGIGEALRKYRNLTSGGVGFREVCDDIASYRYIDDTKGSVQKP